MTLNLRRSVPTAAAALALAASAATSAHAGTTAWDDPVDDTWVVDYNEGTQTQEPDHPEADLIATRVTYSGRAATVVATWDDLQKTGTGGTLDVMFLTPELVHRPASVTLSRRNWEGRSSIFEDRGPRIDCGVSHQVDYVQDTVRLRVPSRCFQRPAWVKVAVHSEWTTDEVEYHDNPHDSEPSGGFSGRIRRG